MLSKKDFAILAENEENMDIKVNREISQDNELIFTIKVSDPHILNLLVLEDKTALLKIESFLMQLEMLINPEGRLYQDIVNANHNLKEKIFTRFLDSLKFSIENEFRPKFKPICQEIYNWIFDRQEGHIKTWMTQFDPQRTTYYFDNDNKKPDSYSKEPIVVENDDEDEDEEDEDD